MSNIPVRPKNIGLAVCLLLLATTIAFGREMMDSGDLFVAGGLALAAACIYLVIHRIFVGRNWARIIFLFMVVVGMSTSVPEMIAVAHSDPLLASFNFALLAIQLAALYLLFTLPGSAWFKRPVPLP